MEILRRRAAHLLSVLVIVGPFQRAALAEPGSVPVVATRPAVAASILVAEEAAAEGRRLCAERRFDDCIKRLQAADALAHTPSTGLSLAEAQASLGLLVEARQTISRVLDAAPSLVAAAASTGIHDAAARLDAEVKERLATLRFTVSGVSAGTLPTVWVDENVNPVAVEAPLKVNPGRHLILARTDFQQVRASVDAREGSVVPVPLNFTAAPSPESLRTPLEENKNSLPTGAYIGFGVGAAGFVVGGVTGLMALIASKPNDPRCGASSCPPNSWNDNNPAQRALITTSTASLAIGAAGLGFALGSILLHKKHEPKPSSAQSITESLRINPALGGMSVSGKF